MVEDTNSEKKVVDMVDSNSFFFEVTSKNGAILRGPSRVCIAKYSTAFRDMSKTLLD